MHTLKQIAPGLIMIFVSLLFLSQAITMEKASIFDPAGGSFLPALIALIMIVAGLTVVFQEIRKVKFTSNLNASENDKEDTEDKLTFKEYKLILIYFLLILIYVGVLSIVTFFPATLLFLLLSMVYLRNVSLKVNILVSIGSVVIIYLLFSQVFQIIFP
ncbi:tripartite tricarboxylate transporter TctB family protein [Virgibacillus sp. W0430]|uniref:tripartite tricarboxylate transporter TctB family protein n=1 Tax=Virgibacillus sp. W0430 TaxID=3391580 RepID=UPI003F48AE44